MKRLTLGSRCWSCWPHCRWHGPRLPLELRRPPARAGRLDAAAPACLRRLRRPSKIDKGDTAWMLTSSALVLLMRAGAGALLRRHGAPEERARHADAELHHHGGRSRPVDPVRLQPGVRPRQGRLHRRAGVDRPRGVGLRAFRHLPKTIPDQAFMLFQMMFAIITPALISGAFAERMKFSAFLLFTLLWTTFVYDPLAHWVWGDGGWLKGKGALDFAGGTVVHISSGVSALSARSSSAGARAMGTAHAAPQPAHDPDGRGPAVVRLVRLQRRQRARGERSGGQRLHGDQHRRRRCRAGLDVHGVDDARQADRAWAASGAVAGLVAITPASGYVGPMSALIIGAIAGASATRRVSQVELGYDDSLDVFGVHGVGGPWGALATGSSPRRPSTRRAATGCSSATPASCGRRSWRCWPPTCLPSSAPSSSSRSWTRSSACASPTRTKWPDWISAALGDGHAFGGGSYSEYTTTAARSPRPCGRPKRRRGPRTSARLISGTRFH